MPAMIVLRCEVEGYFSERAARITPARVRKLNLDEGM